MSGGHFYSENARQGLSGRVQFDKDACRTGKSEILFGYCGNSSVGRAQPCQGWGREFESRFPLHDFVLDCDRRSTREVREPSASVVIAYHSNTQSSDALDSLANARCVRASAESLND